MDTETERSFWEVVRHHERPPFHFPEEGVNTRLNKAARVVYEERITPNSDGSFTVEGSGGRTYRCAESCSCPGSQKGKSKWCYHLISTALYVEWQRRLRTTPPPLGSQVLATDPDDAPPVDDQTLPLPLPPVTVEERMAVGGTPAPLGDPMPTDAYPPTPDTPEAPAVLLEPPASKALPGPVLLPSLDARTLELSMQAWSAQRQVVRRFLQQELKEGIDFYRLSIRGRDTKPTLSKAGAEKFLGLFQLQASFAPDLLTWEMLGKPTDHLLYICTLRTRSGEVVGEGRGSRCLKQDGGDTNKALKMSEKSALIDAVLRTGALSEVFTQDREEEAAPAPPAPPARTTSQDLRQRIWALVKARAPQCTTREAVEAWITQETGYALHPDFYQQILLKMEEW